MVLMPSNEPSTMLITCGLEVIGRNNKVCLLCTRIFKNIRYV